MLFSMLSDLGRGYIVARSTASLSIVCGTLETHHRDIVWVQLEVSLLSSPPPSLRFIKTKSTAKRLKKENRLTGIYRLLRTAWSVSYAVNKRLYNKVSRNMRIYLYLRVHCSFLEMLNTNWDYKSLCKYYWVFLLFIGPQSLL